MIVYVFWPFLLSDECLERRRPIIVDRSVHCSNVWVRGPSLAPLLPLLKWGEEELDSDGEGRSVMGKHIRLTVSDAG